jgi:hypothetical protein
VAGPRMMVLAGIPGHDEAAEMLHVEKRHFVMEDVLVCKNDWFSSRKPNDRKLGQAIRFAERANRDAKATGTSEVGSHRISKAKNSLPGWTGSPKWARRRETLGSSIALSKSSDASSGRSTMMEMRSHRDLSYAGARDFECVNGSRWGCASRVCEESRGSSRR